MFCLFSVILVCMCCVCYYEEILFFRRFFILFREIERVDDLCKVFSGVYVGWCGGKEIECYVDVVIGDVESW